MNLCYVIHSRLVIQLQFDDFFLSNVDCKNAKNENLSSLKSTFTNCHSIECRLRMRLRVLYIAFN